MRRCRGAVAVVGALAVALVVVGCGTPSPDLFVVQRTGSVAAARLSLRVQDGGEVTCNGKQAGMMTSDQLIEARELVRALGGGAVDRQNDRTSDRGPLDRNLDLPPGPMAVFRYALRAQEGTIAFSDTSRKQPDAFFRVAKLVRALAKGVCGLPR